MFPRLLVILLTVTASGSSAAAEPVRAKVLSDVNSVRSGADFTVGVLLQIEPGWHVYWKHPGEGGVATEVQVMAPEGFIVHPVQFPVPMQFIQPGDIKGYGYKDQVMFLAKISPPAERTADTEVPIVVQADWLSCDPTVCIPGSARLQLVLPIDSQAHSGKRHAFEEWAGRIPVDAANSPVVRNVDQKVSPGDDSANAGVEMHIRWVESVNAVEFYAALPDELTIEQQSVQQGRGHTIIRFTTALMPGRHRFDDELETVIGFTDSHGRRRGIGVVVPLDLRRAE